MKWPRLRLGEGMERGREWMEGRYQMGSEFQKNDENSWVKLLGSALS